MRDPFQNPFPRPTAARHAIWEMLVPRDIDAFLAADWSMVADDFVEEGFIGIDGQTRGQPRQMAPRLPDACGLSRRMAAAGAGFRRADPLPRTRAPRSSRRRRWKISRSKARWRWSARNSTAALKKPTAAVDVHEVADALLLPPARRALEDLRLHRLPAESDGLRRATIRGNGIAHFHRGARDRDQHLLPDLRRSARLRGFALCAARAASGDADALHRADHRRPAGLRAKRAGS